MQASANPVRDPADRVAAAAPFDQGRQPSAAQRHVSQGNGVGQVIEYSHIAIDISSPDAVILHLSIQLPV